MALLPLLLRSPVAGAGTKYPGVQNISPVAASKVARFLGARPDKRIVSSIT